MSSTFRMRQPPSPERARSDYSTEPGSVSLRERAWANDEGCGRQTTAQLNFVFESCVFRLGCPWSRFNTTSYLMYLVGLISLFMARRGWKDLLGAAARLPHVCHGLGATEPYPGPVDGRPPAGLTTAVSTCRRRSKSLMLCGEANGLASHSRLGDA